MQTTKGFMNSTIKLFGCLTAAGLVVNIGAAEGGSADYAITADTLNSAGAQTASVAYSHVGSLGGLGSTSSAVSLSWVVKHGFIGRFRDVAGLAVTANPTNVNEGESGQLAASLLYDDQTRSPLNGSDVFWSVISGPIASVTPLGLATAGAVYQDTTASVRGQYQSHQGLLDLRVLNVSPDNYGLYAGDGLPDDWQVRYFGLNNPLADPGLDPDGDRQSNFFEYVAGLIPTNNASQFRLTITDVPGTPDHKNVTFTPRFADRNYSVEYRVDPDQGIFIPLTGSIIDDNGIQRTITDQNAINNTRFYRVQISLP